MGVHLVEPRAEGLISGGYLYNRRMAAAAPGVRLHSVRLDALADELAALELSAGDLVLADSLFLTPERWQPFRALAAARRLSLGALLHAFPSFIERAQERESVLRSLPLAPSAAELEICAELDVLVALGAYVPELLRGAGCEVPCAICPPGVDATSPRAQGRAHADGQGSEPPTELCILSLGAVTPLKGLADGVAALAAHAQRRFRWRIVGSTDVAPTFVASLQRSIAAHGLADRVELCGQLPHERALTVLEQSDLLLVTSHTETYSLVALEAIARGVPVLGYAVGGLTSVVSDGVSARLVPLLDVPALTRALARVLEDPGELAQLERGALAQARTLPSWETAGARFVATIAASRKRR